MEDKLISISFRSHVKRKYIKIIKKSNFSKFEKHEAYWILANVYLLLLIFSIMNCRILNLIRQHMQILVERFGMLAKIIRMSN